jgi:endonuclease/exonuclease/phosphatase family metal-dependent hydrolase
VAFDPYQPYGSLVETTIRVVTWNVWGRYGDWEARYGALVAELRREEPDVVCLVESWQTDDGTQADVLGDALGLPGRVSGAAWDADGWRSGLAILSRWPIATHEERQLPGGGAGFGRAVFSCIEGPRGAIQVFVATLDYPLDASGLRQAEVRELASFVRELTRRRHPTIVCGDFNAHPDSDEIRMLTGRAAVPVEGLVFYDAWEVAGDGGPGITWSNANPLAAVAMIPDRRFDYIFSAWPRPGAVGHPVACHLLGTEPHDGVYVSDHYGVVADLRY